jgi:predicted PhzF superfamily epimerase YddE/YHI9
MMIPIYQVGAFTSRVFGGNPAAVCLAAENNLSETAFRGARVRIAGRAALFLEGRIEIS